MEELVAGDIFGVADDSIDVLEVLEEDLGLSHLSAESSAAVLPSAGLLTDS